MIARTVSIAAVLVAAASGIAAQAADPPQGTVSTAAPRAQWSGTLTQGAASYNAFNSDPDAPCTSPSCDSFALTLADGGPLTLTCALDRTASCGLRIRFPDGSTSFSGGIASRDKPYAIRIESASKGAYRVDITDSVAGGPGGYAATATLGDPPGPGPTASPTPPTTPQPPAPTVARLRIVTRRATAGPRRLRVRLRSSAPVDGIRVALRKGSRQLAFRARGRMVSSARVTLRLKRPLRRGRYRLVATATDEYGNPVSAGRTLRVRSGG